MESGFAVGTSPDQFSLARDAPVKARRDDHGIPALDVRVAGGDVDRRRRVEQLRHGKFLVGQHQKQRPGGQRQRIALARALARAPRLILLDEPFSALDRALRAQLTQLVRELVAEAKVPLVHVTHSVKEARALADQVVRIEKGKVVAKGTPDEVLAGITSLEE